MWTTENRPRYNRDKLRYPSDLTDEEWALVEPLIPPAKHGGRRRWVVVREVMNGVMYVLSTGCQWRYLPKDLPPKSTVHDYLTRWNYDGTIERVHHVAVCAVPRGGREGSEPDRLRDRQPEREERGKGGFRIDASGYDAGKKVTGKKRHILVDTLGLLLHAIVHPADIQDRDGGVLLLSTLFGTYPFLVKLFADAGYQGTKFADAVAKHLPHLTIEIVKRSEQAKGFVVLPMRWVVERTLAWLNRCRRLAKDFENLTDNALAFLRLASIRLMMRRLCNPS